MKGSKDYKVCCSPADGDTVSPDGVFCVGMSDVPVQSHSNNSMSAVS